MHKIDILAIGAHPDDIELSCAGTLLTHIAQGKKVGILDLTQGELGSNGTAELRLKEAEASKVLMNAAWRKNLGLSDGFLNEKEESLKKIIEVIRYGQPEIVLCNAINDRHPDHGIGSAMVSRACFLSGLIKIETSYDGLSQLKWRPKAVYHYVQDRYIQPDILVDISNVYEQKMALIDCFGSQFFNPNIEGVKTPISGKTFLEHIRAKDRLFARPLNVEYAEGFTVERPIGIVNMLDLS